MLGKIILSENWEFSEGAAVKQVNEKKTLHHLMGFVAFAMGLVYIYYGSPWVQNVDIHGVFVINKFECHHCPCHGYPSLVRSLKGLEKRSRTYS